MQICRLRTRDNASTHKHESLAVVSVVPECEYAYYQNYWNSLQSITVKFSEKRHATCPTCSSSHSPHFSQGHYVDWHILSKSSLAHFCPLSPPSNAPRCGPERFDRFKFLLFFTTFSKNFNHSLHLF